MAKTNEYRIKRRELYLAELTPRSASHSAQPDGGGQRAAPAGAGPSRRASQPGDGPALARRRSRSARAW